MTNTAAGRVDGRGRHPLAMLALLGALACAAPGPRGALSRAVSFPTADGGVVHADLYGGGARAVVLAHGGRFTKESWSAQAPVLADAGLRVLAIDFRGRGPSRGGSAPGAEAHTHLDVLAAIGYLHAGGATSVAVVGASFGGVAAARAALEAPPGAIDRLALLAAQGIEAPERLPGPTLFLVARDDVRGDGVRRLDDIAADFARAPEPKRLVVLEGDAHAQLLFETDQGPRVLDEIVRFLTAP